jgi:ornithine decarboxylase
MGVNFDCASRGEIDLVMSIGVTADRIIYANPCKPKAHLNYAREVGVNISVFDGEAELYKIKECHPNCKLLMRIATDDSKSKCAFSVKFGARENQWQRLLNVAKSLDLNVVGVR